MFRGTHDMAEQVILETECQDSVVLCVKVALKIPAAKKRATVTALWDLHSHFGDILQFNVDTEKVWHGRCHVCGWEHDAGFTQIKADQGEVIQLGGILPDIIALIHGAHAKGLLGLSTKDEKLLKICGGYKHPCKAFDDLKHRSDYKILFETRKRGFISLRGVVGINRNKSERNPE
jgi:hypothetical protein